MSSSDTDSKENELAESFLLISKIKPIEIAITYPKILGTDSILYFGKQRILVTGSKVPVYKSGDGCGVKFYNLDSQTKLKECETYEGGIGSLLRLDDDRFLVGSSKGGIDLYSIEKMTKMEEIVRTFNGNVKMVRLNEDIICVAQRENHYTIEIVSISQKKVLHSIKEILELNSLCGSVKFPLSIYIADLISFGLEHNGEIRLIQFEDDFKGHNTIKTFNEHTWMQIHALTTYSNPSEEEVLVAGGMEGRIYFYNTDTGKGFRTLQLENRIYSFLTFNNQYLLVGLFDGGVTLFDDLHLDHKPEIIEKVRGTSPDRIDPFYDPSTKYHGTEGIAGMVVDEIHTSIKKALHIKVKKQEKKKQPSNPLAVLSVEGRSPGYGETQKRVCCLIHCGYSEMTKEWKVIAPVGKKEFEFSHDVNGDLRMITFTNVLLSTDFCSEEKEKKEALTSEEKEKEEEEVEDGGEG